MTRLCHWFTSYTSFRLSISLRDIAFSYPLQAILEHLLPAFCTTIHAASESGDTRFFCLRMVSDIVQLMVNEPNLYITTRTSGVASGSVGHLTASSAVVDAAVQQYVLPLIPQLLKDEDPMPLYALKVRSSTARPPSHKCLDSVVFALVHSLSFVFIYEPGLPLCYCFIHMPFLPFILSFIGSIRDRPRQRDSTNIFPPTNP